MPNTAGTITMDVAGRALTPSSPPPTLRRCLAAIDRSVEYVEVGRRLAPSPAQKVAPPVRPARGLRVELDPTIQGKHLKRWTLGSMVATDFARRAVPWVRLELERPTGRDLNLGVRHRLSAAASLAAVVVAGRGRGTALGAATLVLLALNGPFYLLLARRLGPRAALGPPLHAVHHLTALAAVPVAAAAHVRAACGGQT